MMRNFKMMLSYDGTRFLGWQVQKSPQGTTVQETVEKAIHAITSEKIRVVAAGRTDTGVHALGQVAHFRSETRLAPRILKRAIHSQLPGDVRILKVEEAPKNFHAQYWAKSKIYQYRVWTGQDLPVFERHFLMHHPRRLDLGRMKKAAAILIGRHDFSSFRSAGGRFRGDAVRWMKRLSVRKKSFLITFRLEADGFLYKMVRAMVGTLLEVGEGKLTVKDFQNVLREKDRSLAGKTAPAQGLCLMRVRY